MKQLMILLVLSGILLSCNKIKSKTEDISEPAVEQNETIPEISSEVEKDLEKPIPDVPLGFLASYEGKYASQEKLFENNEFKKRLKGLERFNYDALLQNYNTETPVVIIDNIVHMSGCKEHSCPSNAYDFFIDLNNDNINVYYFRNNMLKVYQEKGWIDLPSEFNSEMDIKKENAGVGNPDGIESNYSLQ